MTFYTMSAKYFLLYLVHTGYFTFSLGQTIRGLSLERLSLYNPLKDFTCIDGSVSLPFSYVNDDYCDCPDGSDEPGTSACPMGMFYCLNKGYIPKTIPSGFVNDGFCDCCDASDEYSYNKSNCTDICEELGQEAQRLAEKISQMTVEGSRVRAQMIASAKQILESKQKRMNELEVEKVEALRLKDEAEAAKKGAESKESAALEEYKAKEDAEKLQKTQEEQLEDTKEAQAYFDSYDSNNDKILGFDEMKAQKLFDQNMDGEVSPEELKYIEDSTSEAITFEMFKEVIWPRIKPLIVMNRIKAEENREPSLSQDNNPDLASSQQQDPESGIEEEGVAEEEEDEEENEEEVEVPENKEFPEAPLPKYDEKTASLVEAANQARESFEKASRIVLDVEREINNLKGFLSKDYGEEDEFVPLDGQCFTYTDREYSYKLCLFDQVTQMGKSGGSETRLGSWSGWGEKDYSVMLYDKGQSCWNGPQRSTKVTVSCGLENEVISASEPNKCEYVLEFITPAACKLIDKTKHAHEEL